MSQMHTRQQQLEAFSRLLDIMEELREKCPWDQKQTIASLRHLSIEEVYELSDAILNEDMGEIKKELGDVLLHIIFYSKIASEEQVFDIKSVIDALCEKLIFRHPHIYGDVTADTEEKVKKNWEMLKKNEKGNTSVLGGVPNSLPAIIKASRMQEKASNVGFDWDEKFMVWDKVKEELTEFEETFSEDIIDKVEAEKEFGDVMFSMINYARYIGINPETALEKTNKKFKYRFEFVEKAAKKEGRELSQMTLAEMDVLWEAAKKTEK